MDQQYRLYRRDKGVYYLENTVTHKQESLRTRDRESDRRATPSIPRNGKGP